MHEILSIFTRSVSSKIYPGFLNEGQRQTLVYIISRHHSYYAINFPSLLNVFARQRPLWDSVTVYEDIPIIILQNFP